MVGYIDYFKIILNDDIGVNDYVVLNNIEEYKKEFEYFKSKKLLYVKSIINISELKIDNYNLYHLKTLDDKLDFFLSKDELTKCKLGFFSNDKKNYLGKIHMNDMKNIKYKYIYENDLDISSSDLKLGRLVGYGFDGYIENKFFRLNYKSDS